MSARSPVWNRGDMLIPRVLTYSVDPPKRVGAKVNHAAAQSSTRTTLTSVERSALERFMVASSAPEKCGRPGATPGHPQ
jgi:hypothetical protein